MVDVDEAVVAMVCDEKRMTDVDEAVDVMVVMRTAWSMLMRRSFHGCKIKLIHMADLDESVAPWLRRASTAQDS